MLLTHFPEMQCLIAVLRFFSADILVNYFFLLRHKPSLKRGSGQRPSQPRAWGCDEVIRHKWVLSGYATTRAEGVLMVGALHQKLWEIIFGYFVALGAISPTAQGERAQAKKRGVRDTRGGVPRRGPACRWSAGGGVKERRPPK